VKLTKKQRVINYAKQHPDGFSPKQLLTEAKIKDKNIWVMLSHLKKQGVLAHDPKTKTYKLLNGFNKSGNTALDRARKNDKDTIAHLVDQMVEVAEQRKAISEKYDDALTIIRYLENKLVTSIQYATRADDARSQG